MAAIAPPADFADWSADPDTGIVDQSAEFYRAWVAGEDGKRVVSRLGTQVRTRVYVKTIPPGAADVIRYRFRVPDGAEGKPLRLEARLRYRKFMREYVDFVFPDDKIHEFLHKDGSKTKFDVRNLPTVDMAETSLTLDLGKPARGGEEDWGPETYLRVNDLGIAYLRQKDLVRAKEAFQRVVKMQPEYADGWVNLARVQFQLRQHEEVIASVQKALELVPGFPKAVFFSSATRAASVVARFR